MFKRICIFSLSFFLTTLCYGQLKRQGIPYIKNYSPQEYGMHPRNFAVIRNNRGILYFANAQGLLEFDGTYWNKIELPHGNWGVSFGRDNQDRIYVGSFNELGYLHADKKGKTIFRSLLDKLPQQERDFENVWQIFTTNEAVVFITPSKVLIYRNGEFTIARLKSFPQRIIRTAAIIKGKIYVHENTGKLFRLVNDRLEPAENAHLYEGLDLQTILSSDEDEILMVSEKEGLFRYDGNQIRLQKGSVSDFIRKNSVNEFIKLSNGNYAVGSHHDGIIIFNKEDRILQHISRRQGLQNNTILGMCNDKHGDLWLAMDNGIAYIGLNSPFSFINESMGLQGMGYTCTRVKDEIYFGTSQGVYYKELSGNDNPLNPSSFRKVKGVNEQVYALQYLDGPLYCGHYLHTFNIKDNTAMLVSYPDQIDGSWMCQPLEKNKNYILVGTYHGFSLYKKNKSELIFVRNIEGFRESSRNFEQDEDGYIWVGHVNQGIFRIKFSEDLTCVTEVKNHCLSNNFPPDYFTHVSRINDEIIFCSREGIYRYNKEKDILEKHIGMEQALNLPKNTYIDRIIGDRFGNIWLFKKYDVVLYKKINRQLIADSLSFKTINDLIIGGYEFVYAYDSSNFLIGSQNGFIHYNPEFYVPSKSKSPALIRYIYSKYKQKDSLLFGGNYASDSGADQQLSIPYHLNTLRFCFSAPFYEHTEKNNYQYCLVHQNSKEQQWSSFTKYTEAEFQNLFEGKYTFMVRAKNVYGEISDTSIFTFIVGPPWYRTIWAYLIYLVNGIFVIFMIVLLVSRRFETQRKKLEEANKKELELQEQRHLAEQFKKEKELAELQKQKLENEIHLKNTALASLATNLSQKKEFLSQLKNKLVTVGTDLNQIKNPEFKSIIRNINDDLDFDDEWDKFQIYFDDVHDNFLKRLREQFPKLGPSWLLLCAYLRMNKSSKEIAALLNTSVSAVQKRRYRLKDKFGLSTEEKLMEFIMNF